MTGKVRRPKLRGCVVYWDDAKKRYRITTPKSAKAAMAVKAPKAEAIFLLTDTLDPKDAGDIATFRECLYQSNIAACYYARGPITTDIIARLVAASEK